MRLELWAFVRLHVRLSLSSGGNGQIWRLGLQPELHRADHRVGRLLPNVWNGRVHQGHQQKPPVWDGEAEPVVYDQALRGPARPETARISRTKGSISKQKHHLTLLYSNFHHWIKLRNFLHLQRGSKCQRVVQSGTAVQLAYKNCTSIQAYKPRYCGSCTDGRCCTPHRTKTALVDFQCTNGKSARRPVMVILTCACHSHCPRDNAVWPPSGMTHGSMRL